MACVDIGVSMTARKQPYLGPTLSPQLENGVVWIEDASPTGPAAGLAKHAPIEAVVGIGIDAFDLVEEPNVAPSREVLKRLFDK